MRVLILAFSVLGILVGADAAKAGLSTVDRDAAATIEPAALTDDASQGATQTTQATEDQIGLDKARRRDVQRWLTGLGFDTRINGKFDDKTRAVIARWQDARGYPRSGFLDSTQHQALMAENIAAAHADLGSTDNASGDHPVQRRSGARHRPGGGGPVGLIGGLVGGLFGR